MICLHKHSQSGVLPTLLLLSPAQKAITVPDKNKHLFSQAATTHFWVSVQEEGVPATGRPDHSLN